MFKSISITNNSINYNYSNMREVCLIDSDFTEYCMVELYGGFIKAIMKVYSERKLNVAYNIVIFFETNNNISTITVEKLNELSNLVEGFSKYVEDIKILMLFG